MNHPKHIVGVLVCWLLAVSAPAFAQSDEGLPRAIELNAEGTELYELGEYAQAAAKFRAAFELSGEPAVLKSVFVAWWEARDCEPALEAIREYEALSGGGDPDAKVIRSACENLEVADPPENGDEHEADREPEIKEDPPPAEPARVEPVEPPTAPVQRTGGVGRVIGWTLLTLGGAALVTGGVQAGIHASKKRDYDAAVEDAAKARARQLDSELNRIEASNPWLLAIGGGLAAGGVVTLLLTSASEVEAAVLLGPQGLTLLGTF